MRILERSNKLQVFGSVVIVIALIVSIFANRALGMFVEYEWIYIVAIVAVLATLVLELREG